MTRRKQTNPSEPLTMPIKLQLIFMAGEQPLASMQADVDMPLSDDPKVVPLVGMRLDATLLIQQLATALRAQQVKAEASALLVPAREPLMLPTRRKG